MIRTFLFLLLTTFSINLYSQGFRLGFQASPQLSWMNSDKVGISNHGVQAGLKYGLETDLFIAGSKRYCINTGLFVSNHSFSALYNLEQSFQLDQRIFDKEVTVKYKLNYLEVPINIKLKTDQFYRSTFYGQFGLTNQINLNATAVSDDNQLSNTNVNKNIVMYNVAMLVGAGCEYDLAGNTALNIGLQYTNGLMDITTINNLDEKTKFNSLRLILGIMF